jgi:hypothetical protein
MRVVRGGIAARESYAPTPAIGVSVTYQQISDVTNYIRPSWGDAARPMPAPARWGRCAKARSPR